MSRNRSPERKRMTSIWDEQVPEFHDVSDVDGACIGDVAAPPVLHSVSSGKSSQKRISDEYCKYRIFCIKCNFFIAWCIPVIFCCIIFVWSSVNEAKKKLRLDDDAPHHAVSMFNSTSVSVSDTTTAHMSMFSKSSRIDEQLEASQALVRLNDIVNYRATVLKRSIVFVFVLLGSASFRDGWRLPGSVHGWFRSEVASTKHKHSTTGTFKILSFFKMTVFILWRNSLICFRSWSCLTLWWESWCCLALKSRCKWTNGPALRFSNLLTGKKIIMVSWKNYGSFDIIMLHQLCFYYFRYKDTIKQLEEEILENLPEIFKRPAADEVASSSLLRFITTLLTLLL